MKLRSVSQNARTLGVSKSVRIVLQIGGAMVFATASLISHSAVAETTLCRPESGFPKAIGWDSSTRVAKFTDFLGKTYVGKVVLTRPHDKGTKVNMSFEFGKDSDWSMKELTSAEFIVFPTGDKFHVIGVGYSTIDGHKYLTLSLGDSPASCVSL